VLNLLPRVHESLTSTLGKPHIGILLHRSIPLPLTYPAKTETFDQSILYDKVGDDLEDPMRERRRISSVPCRVECAKVDEIPPPSSTGEVFIDGYEAGVGGEDRGPGGEEYVLMCHRWLSAGGLADEAEIV